MLIRVVVNAQHHSNDACCRTGLSRALVADHEPNSEHLIMQLSTDARCAVTWASEHGRRWKVLLIGIGEMKAARAACADLTEAAGTVRAPFGWEDGPLVTAMRRGDMILIDELNLADDAVIERLNRHGSSFSDAKCRSGPCHVVPCD